MSLNIITEIKPPNRFLHYLSIGSKPGKISELDGLRAIAILLVLFFHFAVFYAEIRGSYYREFVPDLVDQFMRNGWLGVDLFFVLSGFLIFNHLLAVQNQPDQVQTYGRYALKRFLRTFPLYYAIIFLIGFQLIPGLNTVIIWLVVLMLMVVVYKSWSISQIDGVFSYHSYFVNYRSPFQYALVSILVGVVIAKCVQLNAPMVLPKLTLLAAVNVLAILVFMNLYNPQHWPWVNVLQFWVVALFGVVVWAAVKLTGHKWMRWLCGRTLRVISVLSYSLYLAHYAVLPGVKKLHDHFIRSEEAWIHVSTFFLLYILISFLFSLLLHYVVEKPFLLLKDRL